jgi:hypothetical protein
VCVGFEHDYSCCLVTEFISIYSARTKHQCEPTIVHYETPRNCDIDLELMISNARFPSEVG